MAQHSHLEDTTAYAQRKSASETLSLAHTAGNLAASGST